MEAEYEMIKFEGKCLHSQVLVEIMPHKKLFFYSGSDEDEQLFSQLKKKEQEKILSGERHGISDNNEPNGDRCWILLPYSEAFQEIRGLYRKKGMPRRSSSRRSSSSSSSQGDSSSESSVSSGDESAEDDPNQGMEHSS